MSSLMKKASFTAPSFKKMSSFSAPSFKSPSFSFGRKDSNSAGLGAAADDELDRTRLLLHLNTTKTSFSAVDNIGSCYLSAKLVSLDGTDIKVCSCGGSVAMEARVSHGGGGACTCTPELVEPAPSDEQDPRPQQCAY